MNSGDQEALRELLGDPRFRRILDVFRSKLGRDGTARGLIELADEQEAFALGGLIGKPLRPGQRLQLRRVERHLLEDTRFGCSLREAIEIVDGEPLLTREEERRSRTVAFNASLTSIRAAIESAHLDGVDRQRLMEWTNGDQTEIKRRWSRDSGGLERNVTQALRCLECLPAEDSVSRSLAELANLALGDPHALDRGSTLGTLFDRMLAACVGMDEQIDRGEERDALLAGVGVVQDRTSAKVDTFGLQGSRPDLALLEKYPLRSFTLRELEQMKEPELMAPSGVVHVVENASVFDWLVAELQDVPRLQRPSLVCSNGWLNMADRTLLRMLLSVGASVRYAGDFDYRGLAIANDVLQRFPNAELWRMGAEDYSCAISDRSEAIDTDAFARLSHAFPDLVREIKGRGRLVYQESLQAELLADLLTSSPREPQRGIHGKHSGEVKA